MTLDESDKTSLSNNKVIVVSNDAIIWKFEHSTNSRIVHNMYCFPSCLFEWRDPNQVLNFKIHLSCSF